MFKPICCLSSHNRCRVRLTLGQVGWLGRPGFHHDLVEGPLSFGSAHPSNKGCFCYLRPATGQLKCQESCSQPCREFLGNQNTLQVSGDSHCCHGRTSFLPQHSTADPRTGHDVNPCHSHSWCIAQQRARVWVGRQQGCAEMSSPHLSPTCNPSSGNQRRPKCKTSRVRNQETFEFKRAGKPMGHVHPIP